MARSGGVIAAYEGMTAEDLRIFERSTYNHFETWGRKVQVSGVFYEVLKRKGMDLKYVEANPNIEDPFDA